MIFALIQIGMSFMASGSYAWQGNLRQTIYWFAAGVIGLAVTL